MSASCAPPAEAGATPVAATRPVVVWLVPDPRRGSGAGPAAAVPAADLDVLDDLDRARLSDFPDPHDARTWAHRRATFRRVLGRCLDRPARQVGWGHLPCPGCGASHGKPVLRGDTGLHFSVSHTAGLAVIAVHDRPVGVDVERLVPGDGDGPLARALHPAELAALAALPPARRSVAFLHCWVRKEAVLKATGEGLTREPDRLDVGPGPWFGHPSQVGGGWAAHPFHASVGPRCGPADGVVGAVAVRADVGARVDVRWCDVAA